LSKILLHTCCAPCSTYVNKWLAENGHEVKALFYNPNIQPQVEYERRLLTMEHYATSVGLKVIYMNNDVLTVPGRCDDCYRVRLRKAADHAKELGFEAFTTTLLISPYQKHDLLREIGEEIAYEVGVPFLYHDFREGFRESQQLARGMKLYRQKYCGCGIDVSSRKERSYAQVS
jgi:predicted adenine nucleotide alpha hydrolase (AANH) superfamily ATPase